MDETGQICHGIAPRRRHSETSVAVDLTPNENGKGVVSRETIVNLPVGCAPPRAMDYNPNEQRLLAQK